PSRTLLTFVLLGLGMTVHAEPSQCWVSVRNWQRPPGWSPTAPTSPADRAAKPATSNPLRGGGLNETDQVTPTAAATGSAPTAAADVAAATITPRRISHPRTHLLRRNLQPHYVL